ncbi:radical SAM protein [Streptomyces sp. NPDC056716]|uniref:radical SAM protein n=1 Tax=unclassified Streptomyces TaxID=2593676 RepID=UPI0036C2B4CA
MTVAKSRPVSTEDKAASCYFRTTVQAPYRKALVQIAEPCNERCAHCFVSATKRGSYMRLEAVRDRLIPQLAAACATRITLTGGEPFMHAGLNRALERFVRLEPTTSASRSWPNAPTQTDHCADHTLRRIEESLLALDHGHVADRHLGPPRTADAA